MTARRWALAGVILTVLPWAAMYLLTWLFSGVGFLDDDRPDMPWWLHALFLGALAVPVVGIVGAQKLDPDPQQALPWLIAATVGSAAMATGAGMFGLPFFFPATILFTVALAKALQT